MSAISKPSFREKLECLPDFYGFVMEQFRQNPEDIDVYVEIALEDYEKEGNISFLLLALHTIADVKRIHVSQLADLSNLLTRTSLDLAELRDILHALGYRLSAEPLDAKPAE